jgi:hypothetical protein
MPIFRAISIFLSAALLVSTAFHVLLLSSDSSEYRAWVYAQIVLQVFGSWLLWRGRNANLRAILAFPILAIPMVYINAMHLNYGNGAILWLGPAVALILYLATSWLAWAGSGERTNGA